MRAMLVVVCLLTACSSRGVRCDARLQPINPGLPQVVTEVRPGRRAP